MVATVSGCHQSVSTGGAVQVERPLAPGTRVSIDCPSGRITVHASAADRLEVHGRTTGSKLSVTEDAGTLQVRVGGSRRGLLSWLHVGASADLQVQLPAATSLSVDGVSVDVVVDGTSGPLQVRTVSGEQHIDTRARSLNLKSISGNIDARAAAASSTVRSISGDIRLRGLSGQIDVASTSGGVDLEAGDVDMVRLRTVSGDLHAMMQPRDGARLALDTVSGDIALTLPASLDMRLEAETRSGDISGDFSLQRTDRGRRAELLQGGGRTSIHLKTSSGDIRLLKGGHLPATPASAGLNAVAGSRV